CLFQAEDGIRDFHVTGVQTCALPIYFHFDPASIDAGRRPRDADATIVDGKRQTQLVDAYRMAVRDQMRRLLGGQEPRSLCNAEKIGRASCRESVVIKTPAAGSTKNRS